VFEIMLETGDGPSKIVEERGLKQTSDTGAIATAGLALPPIAFIVCPTKNPNSASLPARY
jgi:uncharacterized spore protein YtfJ